jgi:hypothetical protein
MVAEGCLMVLGWLQWLHYMNQNMVAGCQPMRMAAVGNLFVVVEYCHSVFAPVSAGSYCVFVDSRQECSPCFDYLHNERKINCKFRKKMYFMVCLIL